MMVSFMMCRSLFRNPVSQDSLWVEIPIDRASKHGREPFISEVLIVQKKGFHLEQIVANQAHISKLLKQRTPNAPCQSIVIQKNYPLIIMAENQEIVDALFNDERISNFLTKQVPTQLSKYVLTIHLTDQQIYNKFDYTLKAKLVVKNEEPKDL